MFKKFNLKKLYNDLLKKYIVSINVIFDDGDSVEITSSVERNNDILFNYCLDKIELNPYNLKMCTIYVKEN